MLGDFLAEILREIFQVVFTGVVYGTGKLFLTIVSDGRPNLTFERPPPKIERSMKSMFFVRGKRSYLHPVYVNFVGLVLWVAAAVGIYFAVR